MRIAGFGVLVCGLNVICIGRRTGLLVVFSGLDCLRDDWLHWLQLAYAVLGSEHTCGAVLNGRLSSVQILVCTHCLILLMIRARKQGRWWNPLGMGSVHRGGLLRNKQLA